MFDNLSAEIARKRMTPSAFAKSIGIESRTFANKMNGVSSFKVVEVEKIIKALVTEDVKQIITAQGGQVYEYLFKWSN
jgi:hypothetical protein